MKKETISGYRKEFPWDKETAFHDTVNENECAGSASDSISHDSMEPALSIFEVSNLIDQMVMDIQHLELEIVRTRYRLSFHLPSPYDEYMREEIFNGMGSRYGGNDVYDKYLSLRGYKEYEDAIDTPFHVKRIQRLAQGYDDYPDLYP